MKSVIDHLVGKNVVLLISNRWSCLIRLLESLQEQTKRLNVVNAVDTNHLDFLKASDAFPLGFSAENMGSQGQKAE